MFSGVVIQPLSRGMCMSLLAAVHVSHQYLLKQAKGNRIRRTTSVSSNSIYLQSNGGVKRRLRYAGCS